MAQDRFSFSADDDSAAQTANVLVLIRSPPCVVFLPSIYVYNAYLYACADCAKSLGFLCTEIPIACKYPRRRRDISFLRACKHIRDGV